MSDARHFVPGRLEPLAADLGPVAESRELAVSAALTGLLVARGSIPQVAALLDEQLATGANQVLIPIVNESTTIPCPRTREDERADLEKRRVMTTLSLVELTALHNIRQLKARYAFFLDTKDWDEFLRLFTDDMVGKFGEGPEIVGGKRFAEQRPKPPAPPQPCTSSTNRFCG